MRAECQDGCLQEACCQVGKSHLNEHVSTTSAAETGTDTDTDIDINTYIDIDMDMEMDIDINSGIDSVRSSRSKASIQQYDLK